MARRFVYFTLAEFIASKTAKRLGIDNTPTFEVVEHLCELTQTVLEPMRAAYGKRITVSSGYRCARLNKAVGGVADSVHQEGWAADLQADDMAGFKKFVVEWFRKTRTRFDQCIIERDASGHEWIHIGLYSPTGAQRGQIFKLAA